LDQLNVKNKSLEHGNELISQQEALSSHSLKMEQLQQELIETKQELEQQCLMQTTMEMQYHNWTTTLKGWGLLSTRPNILTKGQ
jgi:hypothetical protein